ncbi:MAG: HU family DNA-binding protein [Caldisericaceae bacterium]|nr:HU family DNA-binding protein [Caldisericaceae bacterium]
MKKPELISAIAEKTGAKKKDVEAFLNAFVETVEEALAKGDKVSLIGFGTFGVRERAARKGVNPKTGKPINIPATKAPYFKAGKTLKEKVK